MRNQLCAVALTAILAASSLWGERRAIVPAEFAPAPGAPAPMYSPGILADGTLYISGMMGQDLKTKGIPADFENEVRTCLANIGLVLKAAGLTAEDVVSVQAYLTDMDLFPA